MILMWMTLIPFAGGLAAWVAARRDGRLARWISLIALAADLVLLACLWWGGHGNPGPAAGQWIAEFDRPWIPTLGIGFHLAMDGLSLLLILLTVFLGMAAVLTSWTEIERDIGFFHFNLMATLTGIIGVFISMDLFLFYFFWELMLVPMYFLIALWGHERRRYASVKFFLFTQLSGLVMLAAILGLFFIHGRETGIYTFDYLKLLGTPVSPEAARLIMAGFLAAFLVKLPAVPFHTWLPDAHTEAPTAGSVILAGLLLKTGAYGIIRFAIPLSPGAAMEFAPLAMAIAVIGILYGAIMAFAQTDIKRLVAYTSVSHMGFVLLGIFAWNEVALQGAVIQMLCHGVSTGALFILCGALQERIGTRDTERMGGLWNSSPRMGGIWIFFALAALGLPGMGNFVGEFLVLLGTYRVSVPMTVLAALGLVVSTIYAVRMVQKIFFGMNVQGWCVPDLSARETASLAALMAVILWIGLYPQPCLDTARGSLEGLREKVQFTLQVTVKDKPTQIGHAGGAHGSRDITALMPMLILTAAPVAIMLVIAVRRSHILTFALSAGAVVAALASIPPASALAPRQVSGLLIIDAYALFFMGLILLAGLFVVLLSYDYLKRHEESREEFYLLLLTALLGSAALTAADHFASFFLGLEVLSVSLYALIAYLRINALCIEAGIKYLILAAFSSAILLFGMALVYAQTGTLTLSGVALAMRSAGSAEPALTAGTVLIIIGIGFKLAVVPFHMWAPDVYEGAPAPVAGFVATASKGAVFAFLLRWFMDPGLVSGGTLATIFTMIAVLSMFAGNLLALFQNNVKRLLAYSSIAHMGYLLVAFLASGPHRVMVVVFYLAAYFVATLGAFGIVTVLSAKDRDADILEDYRGLFYRHPWIAGIFTAMLLSLAGIPLTAGFIGKFFMISAGVASDHWLLVASLVITSAIGLFYYLRVMVTLYSPATPAAEDAGPILPLGKITLAVLVVLLLGLGVYPGPLTDLISAMTVR